MMIKLMIAVTDSGPGFQDDDINILTLPFLQEAKWNGFGSVHCRPDCKNEWRQIETS